MTSPGLRERKKARTRRTIQEQALRLFTRHGFDATTVEQIAEAAEVSPATFFRYYPTKEDLVVGEGADPVMLDAVKHLPRPRHPMTGLREAVRAALERFPASRDTFLACTRLAFTEPGLRARRMDHAFGTQQAIVDHLAEALGGDADQVQLHTYAAAVVGAWGSALMAWAGGDGARPLAEVVDEALAYLETDLAL